VKYYDPLNSNNVSLLYGYSSFVYVHLVNFLFLSNDKYTYKSNETNDIQNCDNSENNTK